MRKADEIISGAIRESVDLKEALFAGHRERILRIAETVFDAVKSGGKVMICGNGGSAADAQHFAAELVNRFEMNRRGLAAVALTHDASVITSIANDFSFDQIFSRQVEALGRPGDLLLAISTSGASPNVIAAVDRAGEIGMSVIALTGKNGGELGQNGNISVHLNINHISTPRIQEMHITCLHILCTLVDDEMFGGAS